MCGSKEEYINLGFDPGKYPSGIHMCLIYSDEEERNRILTRYLESGLVNNELVAYFSDEKDPSEVVPWFQTMGISGLENPAAKFESFSATDIYCPGGRFDPEKVLQKLREFHDRSKESGFRSARVSGEMTWALKNLPGSERLIEYESLVNKVLRTHPIAAICQYDARRFDAEILSEVIEVHPMMIVRGQVARNPYYREPEDFLKGIK